MSKINWCGVGLAAGGLIAIFDLRLATHRWWVVRIRRDHVNNRGLQHWGTIRIDEPCYRIEARGRRPVPGGRAIIYEMVGRTR